MIGYGEFSGELRTRPVSGQVFGWVVAGIFLWFAFCPVPGGVVARGEILSDISGLAFMTRLGSGGSGPSRQLRALLSGLVDWLVWPLILAILYCLVVTPAGLYMRLLGRDPLRLKLEPNARSYWIPRTPPGPDPKTLSNQI